jgi:hypothetical protein
MAAFPIALINELSMQLANALHQHRATFLFFGSYQKVHVVRHQAVRMQRAVCPWQDPGQVEEVESSVLTLEEARCPIIAALDDMDCDPRQHDARTSWHCTINGVAALPLTENVVCP